MGLFTNGNSRITKLIIIQLALSSITLILIQVQGFLPSLDFLTPKELKIVSFSLSTTLVGFKAGEMFFNKVASLFKSPSPEIPTIANPLSTGNTETITKQ